MKCRDEQIMILLVPVALVGLLVVYVFWWGPKQEACEAAGGSLTRDAICVKDILK